MTDEAPTRAQSASVEPKPEQQRVSKPRRHLLPEHGGLAFVIALSVDALGTGLWLPITVLYFSTVAGLSVPSVGLALSVASLIGLGLTPLAGIACDRWGARLVAQAALLIRALAFLGYLLVHHLPELVLLAGLVAAGDRSWPVASQLMTGVLVPQKSRAMWLGVSRSLRNAGMGAGSALTALILFLRGRDDPAAYRLLVLANAITFLIAAVLCSRLPRAQMAREAETRVGRVWRDPTLLRFLLVATPATWCYVALLVVAPVYAVTARHGPAWLAGGILVVNTAVTVALQVPLLRVLRRFSVERLTLVGMILLAVAYVLFAGSGVLGGPTAISVGVLLATLALTVGISVFYPASTATLMETAPEPVRGRYLSAYQTLFGLAYVLGPTLLLAMLNWRPSSPWWFLGIATGAAALAYAYLQRGPLRVGTSNG
jgi:MFS family permease